MRETFLTRLCLSSLLALSYSHSVQASLEFVDGSNRYHMYESERRLGVTVRNTGNEALIVQSSVYPAPDEARDELPVTLNPSLLLIPPKASKVIELYYYGEGFPLDRESVFMLKALAIPQVQVKPHQMQLVLSHNLKVFWRPASVGATESQVSKMSWRQAKEPNHFVLKNASPNYFSLTNISLLDVADCPQRIEHIMVKPFSEKAVAFDCPKTAAHKVQFNFIHDNGANEQRQADIQSENDVQP